VKRREAVLGLAVGGLVALALLAVFAIELSGTQAKSKRDVTAQVHQRGVLAAALIDSLFQSVQQQIPQDSRTYGAAVVSSRTMNQNAQRNAFLALLDASGRVIARSRSFTAEGRADVARSAALALLRKGHPYGLGNLLPYGRSGAIDFAVSFPTKSGVRTLVTGFTPAALSTFITGELRKIPGVSGARNYLLDGNAAVLASTNPSVPVGRVFNDPAQVDALKHTSGDAAGHYYVQVPLSHSTWRVVLVAPDGPLFASVSGLRKWIPWAIFLAFALVAIAALMLARRVLRSADQLRDANQRLARTNGALEASNAQLERRATELARSNAELEHFASIASHDLQEPLRKVRTFTQQLSATEGEHLSDRGRDYLARANSAAERMQKLIEDLLKFSRVATHGRPFAAVDLTQVTNEVLEDLEVQVQQTGATVHTGGLPTIMADALQMRQLMQNVISNALKFHRDDVAPEISIEGHVADGEAQLTIRDNGIGFEPRYSRRIFRVFERLHGRTEYPGTGIGLALCRKIAERHGGGIVADSAPGEGATFTVTLPVHHEDEVVDSAAAQNGTASVHEEPYVAA
jgi:signal transduction histidine kinase